MNLTKRFNFFITSIIYWSFVLILFYVIRYLGLKDENAITVDPHVIGRTMDWFIVLGCGGVLLGVFYFLGGVITDRPVFRRMSFGMYLCLQVITYSIFLVIVAFTINFLVQKVFDFELVTGSLFQYRVFWVFVLYFSLFSFILTFMRMVNDKFGRGVLFKIILGMYRTPREEKRIFLFMDLKSSTAYAEKLGHYKYSQLIQECFYDLNEIVFKYEGDIYQYVGDEAVVSWDYNEGIKENRCINCYLEFNELLASKAEYYRYEFGVQPLFKAGLHGGKLIVTEVGVMKKEIAYHGDVINTTARIQSECNNYGEQFLISKELLDELDARKLESKQLGDIQLKGKKQPVEVYAIDSNYSITAKPTMESAVP